MIKITYGIMSRGYHCQKPNDIKLRWSNHKQYRALNWRLISTNPLTWPPRMSSQAHCTSYVFTWCNFWVEKCNFGILMKFRFRIVVRTLKQWRSRQRAARGQRPTAGGRRSPIRSWQRKPRHACGSIIVGFNIFPPNSRSFTDTL